jgi:hypothetical protein
LPTHCQRERRKLAERRKAAFAAEPTGPNQVWQLDFSEFETTTGGPWRIAGCRDYWSTYEHPWHVSPTANRFDAIDAVELALADYQVTFGHPMVADCPVDAETSRRMASQRPALPIRRLHGTARRQHQQRTRGGHTGTNDGVISTTPTSTVEPNSTGAERGRSGHAGADAEGDYCSETRVRKSKQFR